MEKTIAAISTPNGAGGMGVIRISGENALAVAESVFSSVSGKKISEMKGYTASFGKIMDDDEMIDEAVALVFRAPHSYTGEDVVEISCHGGMYVTRRVLRAVISHGAAPAGPGERGLRAARGAAQPLPAPERRARGARGPRPPEADAGESRAHH